MIHSGKLTDSHSLSITHWLVNTIKIPTLTDWRILINSLTLSLRKTHSHRNKSSIWTQADAGDPGMKYSHWIDWKTSHPRIGLKTSSITSTLFGIQGDKGSQTQRTENKTERYKYLYRSRWSWWRGWLHWAPYGAGHTAYDGRDGLEEQKAAGTS